MSQRRGAGGGGNAGVSPQGGVNLPAISQVPQQQAANDPATAALSSSARQVRFMEGSQGNQNYTAPQPPRRSGKSPPGSPGSPASPTSRGIAYNGGNSKSRLLPMGSKGKSLFTFDRDDIADFEMSRSQVDSVGAMVGASGEEIAAKKAKESVQALDTEELPEINTSEDAISFFAKHGQQTSIKFVHLVREPESDLKPFNPYDLVVVGRGELHAHHPEYWTMSMSGLVHVCPPRPSDFIPLAEWIRKSTLFSVLRTIQFFRRYIDVKLFRIWFKNVKYRTFLKQRSRLIKKFYLARPSFCQTLVDLNSKCFEMKKAQLVIKTKIYDLVDFVKRSDDQRANAFTEFEAHVAGPTGTTEGSISMQKYIDRVAEDLSTRSRMPDENSIDEIDGESSGLHGNDKSKSMYQVRKEKAARLAAVRKAEAELLMMDDFIRLADYMTVETLVMHAIATMQEFLAQLQEMYDAQARNKSLFEVNLQFGDGNLSYFIPNLSDIKEGIIAMTEGVVTIVQNVTRILYHPMLKSHFHGVKPQGPHTAALIKNDETFSKVKDDIDTVLEKNYAVIEEFATTFESYRVIYDSDKSWDVDVFSAKKPTFNDFRTKMNQVKDWSLKIERMQQLDFKGIYKVTTHGLKDDLEKVVNRIMEDLKGILLKNFVSKCMQFSTDLHEKVQVLNKNPEGLKNFVEYMGSIAEMEETRAIIDTEVQAITELFDMLQKFEVKVDPEDEVEHDNMLGEVKAFMEGMDTAKLKVEENKTDMQDKLIKRSQETDEALIKMAQDLESFEYSDPLGSPSDQVLANLMEQEKSLKQLEDKHQVYSEYQGTLQMEAFSQDALEKAKSKFENRKLVWSTFNEWNDLMVKWKEDSDFVTLDTKDIEKITADIKKRTMDMWKKDKDDDVVCHLKRLNEDFSQYIPLMLELGADSMKTVRPWKKIFTIFNRQHMFANEEELPPFNLDDLMKWGIFEDMHKEAIMEIAAIAGGEHALHQTLQGIEDGWNAAEFTVVNYRDQADLFILGSVDDVSVLLEDNQVTLQTILSSRFVMGIKDIVDKWDTKLRYLSDVLEEWIMCQRAWLYLENIFSADDIKKQLPVEAAKFSKVDSLWKKHMRKIDENPRAIDVCDMDGILEQFKSSNQVLDEVQKSLEAYLETKRAAFARFYFLSNDELLQILSETRNPLAVQPHLRKCFDSMQSLQFNLEAEAVEKTEEELLEEEDDDDAKPVEIQGMISAEGEKVSFPRSQYTAGPVEHWLTDVEKEMRKALYDHNKRCLQTYSEDSRDAWFFDSPSAMILCIEQVYWTENCTRALNAMEDGTNPDAMKDHLNFSNQQLDSMVLVVQGKLTKLQRTCMGALIVIDVHARTVTNNMIAAKCSSITDFEWTKQLRYYWEDDCGQLAQGDDDCVVRQTNTRFLYGYEYLGNTPRLVITPLTDKCYMTLTGALHVRLGGAPQGPAGTGKTETTKDLAKALARQCVVFNCSDGLDYLIMGRFFSGLVQCGAWACFDEFNRIDIEVLSVIAQMMMSIINALNDEAAEFLFEGRMIPLNPDIGVFITMNPGYAGRTELPDNLKALFRPVAMMVPDYGLIAEIILFSEGFISASPLSLKMVNLYKLSSEQLSKQDHYDFGMRAVKSVLVMAGQLKRQESHLPEDIVLIRAMRDSNLPKFLAHDVPLFLAIIGDLFPGKEIPSVDYGALQVEIEASLTNNNKQVEPRLVEKIIQFYETLLVRHGVMIVGLTGVGKTTNMDTLADACTTLEEKNIGDGRFVKTEQERLNPKSIRQGELYGETNSVSGEWTDGIVPKIIRAFITADTPSKKWCIFDGPVDAIWIENMNTVLDDNKTLCLNSGERIKLPGVLSMIFEVNDLAVASPATVSRCGMVYMEPVHLPYMRLMESWCADFDKRFPGQGTMVLDLLNQHMVNAMTFVRKKCKEGYPWMEVNHARAFTNLMDSLMKEEKGIKADHPAIATICKLLFCFCFTFSIGGNVHDSSIEKFSDFAREMYKKIVPDYPDTGTVYDYKVDVDSLVFVTWESLMNPFQYDEEQPFFNIMVQTIDTSRLSFLITSLVHQGLNCLLIGTTGVGKSVVMQDVLNNAGSKYVGKVQSFSAQTTARNLQDFFESVLDKRRKTLLGPPAGKQMVFFIDDINMPMTEEYGAQPPIELLRQTIDLGGFYDLDPKKLYLKYVADCNFLAACGPGLSMTPRLVRHFNMLYAPLLAEESMKLIYSSVLGGFLKPFDAQYGALSSKVVDASVLLYRNILAGMRPTPSKCHYTFNLRDLAKVFQGMLQITPKKLTSADQFLRLWAHEAARVFRDRLVDEEDCLWFDENVCTVVKDQFGKEWAKESICDLMFVDYFDGMSADYYEVEELKKFTEEVVEGLESYNMSTSKTMNLVFFTDAVKHVAKIYRIIRQPRGNAMVVGVGGSGRQSMTRMAASMADYKCIQIEIRKGYSSVDFHDDLRECLKVAGVQNKPVCFLFSDTQIVNEGFLEDINNILNSGEVPNLFDGPDKDAVVNDVRPLAKAAGKQETKDVVWLHFVQLCRENMHIVLAMSPVGDGFRTRCRMFPSLVNCCTIDWFSAWPEDALLSVADSKFAGVDVGSAETRSACCQMCVQIHVSVQQISKRFLEEMKRKNYTTPTSYLELITLYQGMLDSQREVVNGKVNRLAGGLKKMAEIEEMVAEMKIKLAEMQPVLAKAAEDTEKLLVEVKGEQEVADVAKEQCKKDEADTNAIAAEATEIKNDAQKDLDEALPAFESAVKALRSLSKDDINTVKSYMNPPEYVKKTLEAVCILLGEKPDWATAKKVMSSMSFMSDLENFDKDNIAPAKIRKLQPYVKDENFNPEKLASISSAAKSLCMWALAMNTYDKVAKNVEPKRMALKGAEEKLQAAQATLKEKQAQLREVEERVAALNNKLQTTLKKKEDLEAQKQLTVVRLERADQLISGLGGEKKRWQETVGQLELDKTNLIGNMLFSAGCVAYIGPFNSGYRLELTQGWTKVCNALKIPVDANFSLDRVLADPVSVKKWESFGLPSDALSVENGLFVQWGRRWPLMIDPQGQANRWIKNMERQRKLKICKLSQGDFLRTLENCIRVGQPVLMENIEEYLDPSLEPLLLKQIYKKGGRLVLRLGDTDVDYIEDFRFYMTTKLPNPHYPPEIQVKVTIVNFTVTQSGLEDQLLNDVVGLERPDLQKQKDELIMMINDGQVTLYELEGKILTLLANAGDDILDDEALITTLADAKKTSNEVGEQVKEAEETAKLIDETREQYRPAAARGSVLYFVIADMAMIERMYQYSLQYFKKLFKFNIEESEKNEDVDIRVKTIIDVCTEEIFFNICRGLFEKDKVLFAFMITSQVLKHSGEIAADNWNFFVSGSGILDTSTVQPYPGGVWMDFNRWVELSELERQSETFKGLTKAMIENESEWKQYCENDEPHKVDFPDGFSDRLTSFQKVLLLKLLRMEKLVFTVPEFVTVNLGKKFVESQPFDLAAPFAASTPDTPIIFVLSTGADPSPYLFKLAKEVGFYEKLRVISLGQGQGPKAEALIESAVKDGEKMKWVCLQNCHLAGSWMPTLERILENLGAGGEPPHKDFRLFLTSMPSDSFPVTILQNGIKLTNEPPKGLRANIRGSYTDIDEGVFDSCEKPAPWKKLLFGMCFFHAVIQERRKFGALGWNITYDWNNSDRAVSVTMLKNYLDEQDNVPWTTLQYVIGVVNYGGRVTDAWDQRAVSCIYKKFCIPVLLEDDHRFDSAGLYLCPTEGNMKHYKDYIEELPMSESPEIFGLHSNAEITFQKKEATALMTNVITLSPVGSGAGGAGAKKPEDIVLDIARNIISKLPQNLDPEDAHEVTYKLDPSGALNSLGLFHSMEVIKFNLLLSKMRTTLAGLESAMQGLSVMSAELEAMYQSFLIQRTPSNWEKLCYVSLKPLSSWCEDLFSRIRMMDDWMKCGPPNLFWLAGMFFPQGFMTAVLQQHSRKTAIAIDTLAFQCEVKQETRNSPLCPLAMKAADEVEMDFQVPDDGVHVYGMFMQGARWSREKGCIEDSIAGELFCPMPIIWLEPIIPEVLKPADDKISQREGCYRCPMYKTSTRAGTLSTTGHSTNYVVCLDIPHGGAGEEKWVCCGVAMLCMLDE